MNAEKYIEKGMVWDYCLGLLTGEDKVNFELALLLYPELVREMEAVQSTLEGYATSYSRTPKAGTKEKIWNTLQNLALEQEMDMNALPLINKYTDYKAWLAAVKPLLPETVGDTPFMHVLTGTDEVTQVLIMSATDIPDEVHVDVFESFIILEGECECHIGQDRVVRVKAGEYLEIPLHEHHDVKIISKYVVGIMQRVAA